MGKIKNCLICIVTIAAGYLLACGIKLTVLPEAGWKQEWLPVQIAMIIVGGAWLVLFVSANNVENEVWGDDKNERSL